MSIYVRVKRKRTTWFMHVEPNDTILEVKQKLQELTEQVIQLVCPTAGMLTRPVLLTPIA